MAGQPLAARMRPRSLGEFVGQEHLLARGSALRTAIEEGQPALDDPVRPARDREDDAGPPARGERAGGVRGGVGGERRPRGGARRDRARAQHRLQTSGERTIFFLDEIHRFNKAQQDTLLPAVEDGTVVLVGATTENPYFEVNSALLSRCRDLRAALARGPSTCSRCCSARSAAEQGLARTPPRGGRRRARVPRGALGRRRAHRAVGARAGRRDGGRGRRGHARAWPRTPSSAAPILYDKGGDLHYDLISAWIKATRGSDPDASLLYLAAMIEGGEDPRFIARRMVGAGERGHRQRRPARARGGGDAAHAVEHVGMPECALNLAQAAVYLALAPKSNASYEGIKRARAWVREHGTPEPPAGAAERRLPGREEARPRRWTTTTRTTVPRASPSRS